MFYKRKSARLCEHFRRDCFRRNWYQETVTSADYVIILGPMSQCVYELLIQILLEIYSSYVKNNDPVES